MEATFHVAQRFQRNAKPSINSRNERAIQNDILNALHAWRIPARAGVTGVRSRSGARQISAARGVPDIVGVLPWGQFLGIEVKRPSGSVLRGPQAEWILETCAMAPLTAVILASHVDDVTGPLQPMLAAWRAGACQDPGRFWERVAGAEFSWRDAQRHAVNEAQMLMEKSCR